MFLGAAGHSINLEYVRETEKGSGKRIVRRPDGNSRPARRTIREEPCARFSKRYISPVSSIFKAPSIFCHCCCLGLLALLTLPCGLHFTPAYVHKFAVDSSLETLQAANKSQRVKFDAPPALFSSSPGRSGDISYRERARSTSTVGKGEHTIPPIGTLEDF
jgi:hypothetical protein